MTSFDAFYGNLLQMPIRGKGEIMPCKVLDSVLRHEETTTMKLTFVDFSISKVSFSFELCIDETGFRFSSRLYDKKEANKNQKMQKIKYSNIKNAICKHSKNE